MTKPCFRGIAALVAAAVAGGGLLGCYSPTVVRQRSYHPSDADLTITRIVHGSFVADFGTTRILVDPWFAPTPPLGQREPIGIPLDRIPGIRGVLLTHGHSDHFDRNTLENYPDKSIRIVTVRGLGPELRAMGYADVVEVDPWERTQIGSVLVTPVPAAHDVPEVGYVLQANGVTAYFAGDTRYDEGQLNGIAQAFPVLDVAVLPVGGVRVFGRRLDMDAEEAAAALRLLSARRAIPSHYGLAGPFPLVLGDSEAPARFSAAARSAAPQTEVVTLEPGESWHYYR